MRRSAFMRLLGLTALFVPGVAYSDLPCKGHEAGENIYLKSPLLDEISGMALSRTNEDIIWGHVDSDGAASLYAIRPNGDYVRKVIVKGVNNTDWEDIASGPCSPDALESHCLFIADMGDNKFNRTDKKIHVLKDPVIASLDRDVPMEVEVEKTFFVTYTGLETADAKFANPDSESLMVDPRDGTIYIVSKQSSGGMQTLYRIEPQSCGERVGAAAVPLASFGFASVLGSIKPLMNAVTAADFSPDGTHYLVRTYAAIYEYDVTSKSVAEAFLKPDSEFMTSELQGEAATYMLDGKTILTAAEKYESLAPRPLFHINTCKDTVSSESTFSEGTPVHAIDFDTAAICNAVNAVPAWTYKLVEDNDKDEICDNGMDDDGNGLTDCADEACQSLDACKKGDSDANEATEEAKSSSSDSCSCLTLRQASGVSLPAALLMLACVSVFWRRRRIE